MRETYTGLDFIDILPAVSAGMESLESDILILTYLINLRDDAHINEPVFSFVLRSERTLAYPLNGSFKA